MARRVGSINDQSVEEMDALKGVAKFRGLTDLNNPLINGNADFGGATPVTMQPPAISPIPVEDIRKNESPFTKLGRFLGSNPTNLNQMNQPPEVVEDTMPMPANRPPIPLPTQEQRENHPFKQLANFANSRNTPIPEVLRRPPRQQQENISQQPPQELTQSPSQVSGEESPLSPQLTTNAPEINTPRIYDPRLSGEVSKNVEQGIADRMRSGQPITFAVPGALQQAFESPEKKSILEQFFGREIDPELLRQMTIAETALADQGVSKDAEVKFYQDKIKNHDLTTADKVILGLALIAPAVLGGIVAGPEGVFKSLGGGLENLNKELSKQDEQKMDDYERLSTSRKEKTEIDLNKIELKQKFLDLMPNSALKKALRGEDLKVIQDEDGQARLGIGTRVEDLLIDGSKVRDTEDLKNFKEKHVKEALPYITTMQGANSTFDKLDHILDQLRDIGGLRQVAGSGTGLLQRTVTTQEGRKMTAEAALEQLQKDLQVRYNNMRGFTRITPQVGEHWEGLLANPFGGKSFWQGKDFQTIRSQAAELRQLINEEVLQIVKNEGFLVEPFLKKLNDNPYIKADRDEIKAERAAQEIVKNPKKLKSALGGDYIKVGA